MDSELNWLDFEPYFPDARGGLGRGQGLAGGNGTVTGKACPRGLYGVFCEVASSFYVLWYLTCFATQ